MEKKDFQNTCKNKKDDYLCTPLNNGKPLTKGLGKESLREKGRKKTSEIFSEKLGRKEKLITFAPRLNNGKHHKRVTKKQRELERKTKKKNFKKFFRKACQ